MISRKFRLSCLLLALCFLIPMFVMPATASQPTPLTIFAEGIQPGELDSMAVDPQSFRLHRDTTWNDFSQNPVANWMEELNPASLSNPTSRGGGRPVPINGGLVLVDYMDRAFISSQPQGSDVLGFYLYADDGSGYDYEAGIRRNPVNSILDFPERYPNGADDLIHFWRDYLNDPTFTELNHGATIDGYWRENSYGRWRVDLASYGVYTIPYFEFELISSYQSYRDVPPTFRHAVPTAAGGNIAGSGNTRSNNFDSHAATVARVGAADSASLASIYTDIRDVKAQYGITQFGGLKRSVPTPFNDFDFFFFLHSGYCESGSWQPFGQMQASSRAALADIKYINEDGSEWLDPLGPAGRLRIVEDFFNMYPEWIPVYEIRYRNGWANSTGAWNTGQYNAANPQAVERVNSYRQVRFWAETLAAYNEALANDTLDEFIFALPQEDWDWALGYHADTDYVGRTQQRNTRYVPFTSWEGMVGEWSHQTSLSFGTGFGQLGTRTGDSPSSLNFSTQGENTGMAGYAHEFGHVAGWPDNYGNPWANAYSCDTEAWCIMSRGAFAGPYGDLARWSVPGAEANSIPIHAMQGLKTRGTTRGTWYDAGDLLTISVQNLASSYPVVVNIVPRNVPLNIVAPTYTYDWGVPRRTGNVNTNEGYVKGIQLDFGTGTWAYQSTAKTSGFTNNFNNHRTGTVARMAIEVVEATSYDTYTYDTGVLMSSITSASAGTRQVIDTHSYDVDMVDFFLNDLNQPSTRTGDWSRYVLAHMAQQVDALFKAGKSYTDTGYYGSIRDIDLAEGTVDNVRRFPTAFVAGNHDTMGTNGVVLAPGSVRRGEDRAVEIDGAKYDRPIVSGDTVNEWRDARNKLHYYVLARNMVDSNYGQFTSYEVAVRHFDGPAVGGELILEEGAPIAPAKKGNYAVQTYAVTNTGDATDIVRVTLEGAIVDAAPRTRTIKVPWEGGLAPSVAEAGTSFTFNPNNREIYIDRTVPTFFHEQNAVIFNDLYSVGPGETVYFDVLVKTVTGTAADFDLTVKVSSETNPGKTAEAGVTVMTTATAAVSSTNLQDKTTVTITVTEYYMNNGVASSAVVAKESVKLKQNGTQVVKIATPTITHNVTVVVNDNNKISNIYIVKPPAPTPTPKPTPKPTPTPKPSSGGNSQGGNSQK